jgi:hypothetical protein
LLERLNQRLPLLTGGRRDAPERHRALRATIEWSHDLLAADAQSLFARLAVFSGGFDLEAAERVAKADIDTLESLVEESLVRHRDDRLSMLETIREYAIERLGADPGASELRAAHAHYYLEQAENAARALEGSEAGDAIDRLTADEDNLRAALGWFIEAGAAKESLRLCVAMTDFWEMRSELEESIRWFERATELPGEVDPGLRALALREFGGTCHFANRYEQSVGLLEESVALWRSIGDDAGLAVRRARAGYSAKPWRSAGNVGTAQVNAVCTTCSVRSNGTWETSTKGPSCSGARSKPPATSGPPSQPALPCTVSPTSSLTAGTSSARKTSTLTP